MTQNGHHEINAKLHFQNYMYMRNILLIAIIITFYSNALFASDTVSTTEVVLAAEVKWGPLNPARGNKGPMAGNLWGDRTDSGSSGFLVKFKEGFSSPPHIHNVTYRGIVISGLVHNDDPGAEEMWLSTSSYWTQPAGEVHITSANASNNLAYIEIEEGPYLVLPTEKAFDNGERPINVDASNIVWLDQPGIPVTTNGPKVAYLWSKPHQNKLSGTLVKLQSGFNAELHSNASTLRAVVVQGRTNHQVLDDSEVKNLEPGSYFGSTSKTVHQISCAEGEDCIIYVRSNGNFNVIQQLRK